MPTQPTDSFLDFNLSVGYFVGRFLDLSDRVLMSACERPAAWEMGAD